MATTSQDGKKRPPAKSLGETKALGPRAPKKLSPANKHTRERRASPGQARDVRSLERGPAKPRGFQTHRNSEGANGTTAKCCFCL